jgi:hypothetical protein
MLSKFYSGTGRKGGFVVLMLLMIASVRAHGQAVKWEIISPLQNSYSVNENLFIAATINEPYLFGAPSDVRIFIDNRVVTGTLKLNGNKLQFIYPGQLSQGMHQIKIEAELEGKKAVITNWNFYEGYAPNDTTTGGDSVKRRRDPLTMAGMLTADNRNEYITGPGAPLRQEPSYTRNLFLDAELRYRNASLPVRIYMTSNNRFAQQTMNFYQVGFKNTWVELQAGDLNPNFDQLILTGVRVRGGSVKLKYRANSVEVVHGQLNQAAEGTLETYIPGAGIIPSNLINDSQYIAPGTYKRMLSAVRFEFGNMNDDFRIALTSMKAKDDQGSIHFGLLPKDNLCNGLDGTAKLFKKKVELQAGIAGSVLTDNAALGPVTKVALDTMYGMKVPINPEKLEWLITLNTSSIPLNFSGMDYYSYYGKANYRNKYQNLFIEYRKNGPLYRSLGNPFLRNNYEGLTIGERVPLWKRKVILAATYMNYSNSLNNNLGNKIHTEVLKGNASITPGRKLPSVYLSYLSQKRTGTVAQENVLGTDDRSTNYMVNIDYGKKFWSIDHRFRLLFSMNNRKDLLREQNSMTTFNGSFGINENFGSVNLNVEIGKTILEDIEKERLSDINTYSFAVDWQIKPEKYLLTASVSNNTVLPTLYADQSYRLAASMRFTYKFLKGMGLELEGGYQPYRSKMEEEAYDESYFYVRYLCDLGMLL